MLLFKGGVLIYAEYCMSSCVCVCVCVCVCEREKKFQRMFFSFFPVMFVAHFDALMTGVGAPK